VGKSSAPIRSDPFLVISSDKNQLYTNEPSNPNKLYKFDITTDSIPNPTSTQHLSGFLANTYLLAENESKIFTSSGQVWSNTPDLASSTKIGTFGALGYLVHVPSLGVVAVLGNSGVIKFIKTTDYSITSARLISPTTVFGPSAINAAEDKLFLNTNAGIVTTDLDPSISSSSWGEIQTYSAGQGSSLPGGLLCSLPTTNCTNNVNRLADKAHTYAINAYELYKSLFNRNSIDNNGMTIKSSVDYCHPYYGCPYQNAFWSGTQMVYGYGMSFANADDVVAHELTHGVTQYESNLFYFHQSGAISESFSDLWGEYFDQINGLGNDTNPVEINSFNGARIVPVKWLLGEDVIETGALRSMSDPTLFRDPDRMLSTYYNKLPAYNDYFDNGGVHTNSGVNNKAVYLMVDGGTFNNKTVSPLGWEKTGAIYYEVQTNRLSSGADYSDLYYALQYACTSLVGQHGITSADCLEVKDAVDAVQMNLDPVAGYAPEAPLCPAGMTTADTLTSFKDDFESGGANWDNHNSPIWSLDSSYASSPSHELWGDDYGNHSDFDVQNAAPITIPAASFLYFKHAFAFEYDQNGYYDGAVLEYYKGDHTQAGDPIWYDAISLYSAGQNYNAIIYKGYGNVLAGRRAFAGDSHGYVSTRYNLSSLTGKQVTFRWRFATDDSYHYLGWFIDDVQVYTCVGTPAIPVLQAPAKNSLTTNYLPLLNWADAIPSAHHYQVQVDDDPTFGSPAVDVDDVSGSQYQVVDPLPDNTTYYWRVRAFNAVDGTLGWSLVWSFRTALLPPVLNAPEDNFASKELRPMFSWDPVDTATGYVIQIAKDTTFKSIVHTGKPLGSSYVPTADLPKGTALVPQLYWRVQTLGANGPSAWSNYRTLSLPVNPPTAVALSSPATNFLSSNFKPTFNWKPTNIPDFQNYILQVSDKADFSHLVIEKTDLTTTSYTPDTNLADNTNYYWRVRVVNTAGEMSNWSTFWVLRTVMLPPTLVAPVDVYASRELRPVFSWQPVDKATGYTVQIAKDVNFTQIVHTGNPILATYIPTADLPKSTVVPTLYWRVQTKGANGPSAFSQARSFTTPSNPSAAPAPLLPASNVVTTNYTPTFTWKAVVPPTGTSITQYLIEIDDDPAFGSPVSGTSATTSFTPASPLTSNLKYYWRVRAENNLGELSNWSVVRYFRTAILPPTLMAPTDGSTGMALMPLLDCENVDGNTGYVLQIWKAGPTPVLVKSVTLTTNTSQYQFVTNLLPGTGYYWKVQSKGRNGPSAWSDAFDFVTLIP